MRNWGYAPEYIKVMWKMLNVHKLNDYIIFAGEAHSLQEFIDKVFIKLGLDPVKFVKFNNALYLPVELEIIYGNTKKAKNEIDWHYSLSCEELVDKLIEDELKFHK